MRHVAALLLALLAFATPAAAQTPITPAHRFTFEIDPGLQRVGTTTNTIPRPQANIAFEYRIDGGTPIAAVKASACTAAASAPAPILTCVLVPPALTPGVHGIEIRALPSPAETGVSPGGFSSSLPVAMILVSSPGTPTTVRLTPPDAP